MGSVWVLVEVTLMQAAFWKATSFPFPSSFWLLCSRSHPAENDPAWKRDSASNQLYPFLQLSGMEQGEILSSVAWGRSCHFFGWLKQVVWLHPELGRHSWPVFCHCFLISGLSLGSYRLHPSPLFHYSMYISRLYHASRRAEGQEKLPEETYEHCCVPRCSFR